MKVELEYDDDTEVAQALEAIAEEAQVRTDGGAANAEIEDVADEAVRQFVAQKYQEMILRP